MTTTTTTPTVSLRPPNVLPPRDYISPNLERIWPDAAFPFMEVGNPQSCGWPYLRRDVPHNWYVDRRAPQIGFVSRDEAALLYNFGRAMAGKRALEIGCWLGWSACHLALGGVTLDVIDPVLLRDDFRQSVQQSLASAGVADRVRLLGGYSPQGALELAARENCKWSLIFIDGNHDEPGPVMDAMACEPLAEEQAMIVFHDLTSPAVARGLDYLRDHPRGAWRTRIYQTMQIMGVAWRGEGVHPPEHHPDPAVNWVLPDHLRNYPLAT